MYIPEQRPAVAIRIVEVPTPELSGIPGVEVATMVLVVVV